MKVVVANTVGNLLTPLIHDLNLKLPIMRTINEIIIHCSATRPDQDVTARNIHNYHISKGWWGIGYHFYIRKDGRIEGGRAVEIPGAHTEGHNQHSIGICYEGGVIRMNDILYNKDTRTPEQVRSMYLLICTLLHCYPSIKKISGHKDYNNTACPCFNARDEYEPVLKEFRANALKMF